MRCAHGTHAALLMRSRLSSGKCPPRCWQRSAQYMVTSVTIWKRRAYSPSAIGEHPRPAVHCKPANRIRGLAPCFYHYRSHQHKLSVVQDSFDPALLGPLLGQQNFANDLAYGIFIVSRFHKLWWKYPHSRAYRVALLDIGCLIQT